MSATSQRRRHGRLRGLTLGERAKRTEHRERTNPAREMAKRLGLVIPKPKVVTVARAKPSRHESKVAERDPHYPRQPLTERHLTLSEDTRIRGGAGSRRRVARAWR